MNSSDENKNIEILIEEPLIDDAESVDDFFRQLEAREKALHITADTTVIEIAASFDDADVPEYLLAAIKEEAEGSRQASVPADKASKKDSVPSSDLAAENNDLKNKILKMEEERAEIFKNSQRRAKDFENFKARAERERRETFESQIGNLATFLLPAMDNFNRAIESAGSVAEARSPEFNSFFEGVVLVNHQMYDILERMGIETIPTVGHRFDPHLHEAVAMDETSDFENGYITAELLRGFRIGDRVVRHSMVKVAQNNAVRSAGSATEAAIDGDRPEGTSAGDPPEIN